jgi:hypothetical protein
MALKRFHELTIEPPVFLSWNFVFISQVVYELVAIKNPDHCCLAGKFAKPYNIAASVNKDLTKLCGLATGKVTNSKISRFISILDLR